MIPNNLITTDLVIGEYSTRTYLPVIPNVGEKLCIHPANYLVTNREFAFAVRGDGSPIYSTLIVTLYLSVI